VGALGDDPDLGVGQFRMYRADGAHGADDPELVGVDDVGVDVKGHRSARSYAGHPLNRASAKIGAQAERELAAPQKTLAAAKC